MNPQYRAATSADARECIQLRGRTRENAISEDRLASIGITATSWAADINDRSAPGFVCTVAKEIVGYCFGASETGEILVLALH
ncbi:MAG: GNAT family N-acetyltransferase, partial [Burkholderiales bacterium]